MKGLAGLAALVLCGACAGPAPAPPSPAAAAAPVPILWAWERPEDLAFLGPGEAKVALLVATLTLEGENVEVYGRRQPLSLPPGLLPIPVVRVETRNPALTEKQLHRLLGELSRRADRRVTPALQIDFDARKSERSFYRALLDGLPADLPVSITALASWCLSDRWLEGAPVAEAVPMLFDLGREGPIVLEKLQRGQDFAEPLCRHSYGLAAGEPRPPLRPGRTLYLFSERPWTPERFRNAANNWR